MIDDFTKFVSCGATLRQKIRDNGSSYNDSSSIPVYIGVNDFDGNILVGFKYIETTDGYGNVYCNSIWFGCVMLPISKFYLGGNGMYEKDGDLFIPNKDRYWLFDADEKAYQKNDNSNNYLLSGSNAIGVTGSRTLYRVYEADRITYETFYEVTEDYVNSDSFVPVDFLSWEDSEVYKADVYGLFSNSAGNIIEVGYAMYRVLVNEGEPNENFLYPKKYIDIVFDETSGDWVWNGYKTTTEPTNSDFTMINDDSEVIELTFLQYSFKFQTAMCFDEGGVK